MGARSRRCSTNIATAVSAALRALICIPVALLEPPAALGQAAQAPTLATDIPAQPLAHALTAFRRRTGLQLVYVSSLIRDQSSHAVAAGLSADAALAQMLQGTGLRFEYLTARSLRIVAAAPAASAAPARALPEDARSEVIVTANRREQYLQDVPITIQVLTGSKLAELNATTFDDFVSYLPNVTAHGVGPAQSNIYIRGLGTAQGSIQAQGVTGTFPNVAIYLDEQSAQLPGRNLDIYSADLERIEILEGPQGTLFGAGAEAGVVRYITNKPKLDVTDGTASAGYAATSHGGPSTALDATLNIPIIPGALAVRAVIYDERRGGYIDNLPATFARAPTDLGIGYAGAAGQVPANSVVINNSALAGNDINPVTYTGLRLEALYQFDEDWSALVAQSYQSIEADGVFAEMAANSLGEPLPDLSVELYNPSYDKDRFENTALTIDGSLGLLKLVYAGSYLVRKVEQVQDYTNYARGELGGYYQCANPLPGDPSTARCFTPSSTWHDVERNTHQSHELRLSTPGDWRIRAVGGLFYEDYQIQEQVDWFYLTALPYFSPVGPPTGYYTVNGSPLLPDGQPVRYFTPGAVFVPSPVTSIDPNVRPPGDGFFDDITRGYTQRAAYASVDVDLVPKTLTLTAGTRYFSTEVTEVGSDVGSFDGCQLLNFPPVPNPCVNHSFFVNLNADHLDHTFSGFRSRANLSWKVTPDALLYYTWSQGFRAGGFNPSYGQEADGKTPLAIGLLAPGPNPWQTQATAHGGWSPPVDFEPDELTNNELGWKTTWGNRRIQWDGALYQEDWNHVQIGALDTNVTGVGIDAINGGDYRVRGIETSAVARVASGLTLEAAAAWNHSELVRQATFFWADGTPIDFSALPSPPGGPKLSNPGGALGSPLAGAPCFQGNARVRYQLTLNGYQTFAQIGAVHQSHSLASTNQLTLDLQGNSIAYDLPGFTTYDAALGVGKDAWLVQLYGENLTDTRAQLYANYSQDYKAVTVSRPRTVGLRFSYKLADR